MLQYAYPRREELQKIYEQNIGLAKNKWYRACNHINFNLKIEDSTWFKIQMICVDAADKIKGYLCATVDRETRSVSTVSAIKFDDDHPIGTDIINFVCLAFKESNANKINFSVIVGNPIEKSYDVVVKTFGGRVVGTKLEDVQLSDGNLYDRKLYEITLREAQKTEEYHQRVVKLK